MAILEVKNLKKYFATQKAVDDISLEMSRGKYLVYWGLTAQAKQY